MSQSSLFNMMQIETLALESSNSVSVLASSSNFFMGSNIEDRLALVDQRIPSRRLIAARPLWQESEDLLTKLQRRGWKVRTFNAGISAEVIVVDESRALLWTVMDHEHPESSWEGTILVDSHDVAQLLKNFNKIWEGSSELLLENLFASSIPRIQNQIIEVSTAFSRHLLASLSQQPEDLYQMHPRKFEELVAELLSRQGYRIEITPFSNDGGRDILAFVPAASMEILQIVECKRQAPNNPVGVGIVRAVYGVVEKEKASAGLVVTTSRFTKPAIKFCDEVKYRMGLADYTQLVEWLRTFGSSK